MSLFSSICHLEDKDDFDVARNVSTGEVRLIVFQEDEDCFLHLSKEKAKHLADLLQRAIDEN